MSFRQSFFIFIISLVTLLSLGVIAAPGDDGQVPNAASVPPENMAPRYFERDGLSERFAPQLQSGGYYRIPRIVLLMYTQLRSPEYFSPPRYDAESRGFEYRLSLFGKIKIALKNDPEYTAAFEMMWELEERLLGKRIKSLPGMESDDGRRMRFRVRGILARDYPGWSAEHDSVIELPRSVRRRTVGDSRSVIEDFKVSIPEWQNPSARQQQFDLFDLPPQSACGEAT